MWNGMSRGHSSVLVHPEDDQKVASDQGEDDGGASKNRTCDLSIISAAL